MRSQLFALSYWMKRNTPNRQLVTVSPAFFLVAAFLLLMIPIRWLLAAIISASIHEACHIFMIRSFGLRIDSVSVGIGGAQIKTEPMTLTQELCCALAGPVGGLTLLLLSRWLPRIAICATFQSVYNLLPIYPHDGGRVLRCLVSSLLPQRIAQRTCNYIEGMILFALASVGIYGTFWLHLGIVPILISWILIVKAAKIPCKPD